MRLRGPDKAERSPDAGTDEPFAGARRDGRPPPSPTTKAVRPVHWGGGGGSATVRIPEKTTPPRGCMRNAIHQADALQAMPTTTGYYAECRPGVQRIGRQIATSMRQAATRALRSAPECHPCIGWGSRATPPQSKPIAPTGGRKAEALRHHPTRPAAPHPRPQMPHRCAHDDQTPANTMRRCAPEC